MLIFSHFTFDNDGMRSSKRQVTFLSLIFLLKCFPKWTTIKYTQSISTVTVLFNCVYTDFHC